MITKHTPASQPSTARNPDGHCDTCFKHYVHCDCPSPARSDLTTTTCPTCGGSGYVDNGHKAIGCDDCDGQGRIIVSRADLEQAERAPSGESWKGTVQQIICDVQIPEGSKQYQHGFVSAKEAILDALARRATAGNAAPDCLHRRQATTALGALTGTGWKCKDCGKLISDAAPDQADNNAATAAPGDLPPLPAPTVRSPTCPATPMYYGADDMREYGRGCWALGRGAAVREYVLTGTASNAGAAPGKQLAHGHREDFYLLANARRIGEQPIHRTVRMPNWLLAAELFATGSSSALQICQDAGIDPDACTIGRAPSNPPVGAKEKDK